MTARTVVVGGGGYQWVPKLLVDIVHTKSLADAELDLQDIDPEPFEPIADFVRHIVDLASILRRQENATLYLDPESSALLES